MCYDREYRIVGEKKTEDTRKERRTRVIDRLLNDGNKPDNKTNQGAEAVRDIAPAK